MSNQVKISMRARLLPDASPDDQRAGSGADPGRGPASERSACARAAWRLTTAQTSVLELLATGQTNKEIACILGIEEGTVEAHVGVIFRKANSTNRAMLVYRFWTLSIGCVAP